MKQKIILPSGGVNAGGRSPIMKQALSGGNAGSPVRASSYGSSRNQPVSSPRVVLPPRRTATPTPEPEPRNTGRSPSLASKYASPDQGRGRRPKAGGGSKMWVIPVVIGAVLLLVFIIIMASSGPKKRNIDYASQVESMGIGKTEKYSGPDFGKKAGAMRDYMNRNDTPDELANRKNRIAESLRNNAVK